ncbi:hypothetical protein NE237_002372 [Protea cynaroides]|uniref:Maternal effect embryo arrest 22 n=1 Tax=Protea cynaroides TaxID=273540 RepID=A0A9Q0KVS8_9MAGN|nr:hypothetical protein NE237_002372 [Protea cynaroides]
MHLTPLDWSSTSEAAPEDPYAPNRVAMAADVAVVLDKEKSCCEVWKVKYSKLEEKRNALRQAVKLLDHEVNKLQAENVSLRKESEEGRVRLKTVEEAKLKESAARAGLENELSDLKSEISLLQKTAGSRSGLDDKVTLLQNRVLEGEAEVNRLRELLEKEKKQVQSDRKKAAEEKKRSSEVAVLQNRVSEGEAELSRLKDLLRKEKKNVESEKKRAEVEKEKAAEAWNLVKAEKKKYEEQKKLASIERTRAEECSLQLDAARTEANETRLNLLAEAEEANKKLEVKKQKLKREKKRAKLEMAKAEEHRKRAEAERKKAIDEKNCADVLAQKLEVEMQRNGALQRKIEEIISGKNPENLPVLSLTNNIDTEMANMKLLEKQLKLEKMQVKLAKKVASVEKVRNNMLQQEIFCLKQEFFRLSHRLSMLDGFLYHSMGGKDDPAKIDNLFDLQNINMKRKMSSIEPCDLNHQSENDLLGPWCPKSERGCTKPISGISSELEYMVGSSVRNTSQNSALHSTAASFSDRQLDSQGRGDFPVTLSAKLAEENLKHGVNMPGLSRDIINTRDRENLGEVSKNNGISLNHRKVESPCLTSSIDVKAKVVTKVPGSRKKRRIQEAVDSIEYFYAKDKKSSLQMKERPSAFHDMLNHEKNGPAAISSQTDGKSLALENGRDLASETVDNLYTKECNSGKKRLVSQKQKLCLQLCVEDVNQKKMDKPRDESCVDANVCTQAVSPVNCLMETAWPCKDKTTDAVMNNCGDEAWFENMLNRDYMKLLELDDAVDEERYREAIEMPLSPTLPEIESHILGASEMTDSQYLIEKNFVGLENGKNSLVPFCSFDVADIDVDSSSHRVNPPVNSFKELGDDGNNFHDAICGAKTGGHQIGESRVEMEVAKQIPIPETEILSASHRSHINDRISKCCVVFSGTKDERSISRIFHSTETCVARLSMVSQNDWIVQKILRAVVLEDLLPEEKACVFFTLLLYNVSVVELVKAGNSSTGDSFSCSDSFLTHIETVMADAECRRIFSELFELDVLLGVIEDFLIDGRVWVSTDVPCGSGYRIFLSDGMTMFLSPQIVSIDKLMVGSIILASICRAVDCISLICDASYSILRMCKFGSSLILRVLHVFAYLCGEKYFTLSNYGLIMTVIKSIVSYLEEGKESFGTNTDSYVPSESDNWSGFSRCPKCPFAEGAVSMDEAILLLLEMLQNCVDFGIKEQNLIRSPNSCSHTVLPFLETAVESFSKSEEDISEMDSNGSSCLSKLDATFQSTSVVNGSLFHFSDILSLVELVACSMNWEWTCRTIIPVLLKMLESSIPEKFSTAIIVLLGQLGRLGIDASGCQKMGVEDLNSRLSDFLNHTTTRKWSFPTQIAIVNSLLGLLSQDFGVLVENKQVLPLDTSQSSHAGIIRKWFTQLSKEQKSLSFNLFQSAGVLSWQREMLHTTG